MRKERFESLLAGTMLALIVATPTLSVAAPDRLESARPLPPSLNGQPLRRREVAPVPPPPLLQRVIPVPEPRAQTPAAPEPLAQAPEAPRETDTRAG
ncbi:MAG: hypothetical protein EXQ82_08940 [Pseudolabrys sp.]|nr:hypothetical protein [Pseudolabrys sp.]